MEKYSVAVQWSEDDEGYIATIPELTGLSAFGVTKEEALSELEVAKEAYLEVFIEDGCQYGGTRHSSQVALRKKGHDTKDIKRAAMTTTDEAHMRYCQINDEELRTLYADANPDNELITFSVSTKKLN